MQANSNVRPLSSSIPITHAGLATLNKKDYNA